MSSRTRAPYVGRTVERLEDQRLLRGRGCYVDDIDCSGVLHAVILRSSVAHGHIRSIDASAARAMPGVHAVLTADDLPGGVPMVPLRMEPHPQVARYEQPVIAQRKVRYVGEPLAVVVADTPALAEDALSGIAVAIEPLPAVTGWEAAIRDDVLLFEEHGTNQVITLTALRGEVDEVFRTADYTRKERFAVHRHTAVPMETRGLLAEWDAATRRLRVSGLMKVPFAVRAVLARLLALPEDSIEGVETDVGAGFGMRGEFYPEDFLVPFAAMRLGKPVKWIEDRREHLLACNHARDVDCELELACTRDGRVLGLRGRVATDVGAYIRTNAIAPSRNVVQLSTGPYRIPDVDMRLSIQLTNKTPVGTYRGPGRCETDFFRERMFDIVADDLGIDRIEFRRRNLLTRAEIEAPWKFATLQPYNADSFTDSGDYHETLDRCLAEFDWAGKSALNGKLVDGRHHGIAVGCYVEGGASGPREGARLVLEDDGRVAVYTGSSANGQGLATVLTQIAADALERPMSAISAIHHGSTTGVKEGFGSYSSRSSVMGGSAIVTVAKLLRERILAAAAEELDCTVDDVALIGGDRIVARDGRALSLAELAQARAKHGGLSAEGSFASSKRTYSYGAHAAHVSVDARTGHVELVDYVAVEDVGRIINPNTLHGQAMGAVVQGLGGVFLEHLVYDDQGQLLTGSLADYLMPVADSFPCIRAFALENHPSPHNPLGAKGAGEGGIIPVGGVIANAVSAALAPLGVSVTDLPLPPSRIWMLVDACRPRSR